MNTYRRPAPRPAPVQPPNLDGVDDYMSMLRRRHDRWTAIRAWLYIFGVGTLIVGGILVLVAWGVSDREDAANCQRKGGTWMQTGEYTSKCLDVKEIK